MTQDGTAAPQVRITVAVSTMGHRLASLQLPEPRSGLHYLVLVQGYGPQDRLPSALLGRADLSLHALDSRGLSNSRNAALDLSGDGLLVFSDDDLTLDPAGLFQLADTFTADPGLDLAAGWRRELLPAHGRRQMTHRLTLFNSGRICAPELMVRGRAISGRGLRFDPAFGLGARHGQSEEFVFVTDCLRAGCKGMSFPIVTGSHPHESTGDNWHDNDLMRARHAMFRRVFGPWRWLVRPAYAWRHRYRFTGPLAAACFALGHVPGDRQAPKIGGS